MGSDSIVVREPEDEGFAMKLLQVQRRSAFAFLLLGGILICSGCNAGLNDEFAALREKLLVGTEPTGAVPVSELKSQHIAGELQAGTSVVIRARINAGEMSPWTQGQAAFIVTDATGHDGSEDHDPHECPFCSRDIRDHMAIVRCTKDDGQLIPTDAREVLGVAEGELLVVQGTIGDADAEEFVVDAQSIYCVPVK